MNCEIEKWLFFKIMTNDQNIKIIVFHYLSASVNPLMHMCQNGQTHFKNLAANATRFLKYV